MFASTEQIVHVHAGLSPTLSYYSFKSIIGLTTQRAISSALLKLKLKSIHLVSLRWTLFQHVKSMRRDSDLWNNKTLHKTRPLTTNLTCQKSAVLRRHLTELWFFLFLLVSLPFLLLVILLPLCIREMTLASPLAQGVSWVSQSDLSCWMPYDRLFVKLLCSVCSLSPPLSLLTVSPLWNWRALLCFARLIGASVGPKRACTHLCSFCGSIC